MNISIDELYGKITLLEKLVTELKSENIKLSETLKIYQDRLFGKKSEKRKDPDQMTLFNEAELEEETILTDEPEAKVKISYERLKKKRGRKPLPPDLPRIDRIIDLTDEEKRELESKGKLVKIGEECSEKLETIPQQVYVVRQIKYKYSFKMFKHKQESQIITAVSQNDIIPHGIATASTLAYVFSSKFVDGLPYYRQEKIFSRLGIDISRQTMSLWQIYVYNNYLIRLLDIMKEDIKKSYLIGADETSLRVITENGTFIDGKGYMWVYRGYQDDRAMLIYDYKPDRRGDNPVEFLSDYKGYLQSDGFAGYNRAVNSNELTHLGCWAHARRKFMDVYKDKNNKAAHSASKVIIDLIAQMYKIERKIKSDNLDMFRAYNLRQEETLPVLKSIYDWLIANKEKYPPSLNMGKAINYALNQWDSLIVFIEDGRLPIDNNLVESAIRPFVIGRKNWLFAFSSKGASSSAAIYSLVETAKANNREPFAYLRELFEKLPMAQNDDDYRKLLPY